ncbi:hypothetical protein Micbo1qcDRAFT_131833 [Microdochium bolleyi]|uniref:Enoyl reductase (ER) domain-containing protein n=1 Tax=Microdochium bolleyi TaxID=196109 RepID=A0A136JGF3_9PEZI|nr:hypothetical protein Micbo1qcDRAFT_131833 [Microdochium bolleyi]
MTTPIPDKMRAWLYTSVPDGLEKAIFLSENVPTPARTPQTLAKNDILVRVEAASLNPVDHKLPEITNALTPRFLTSAATALPKPTDPVPKGAKTPAHDFAGTVVATGSAVDTVRIGERVFGLTPGTLAEYVVTNYNRLATLPSNASFEEGAAAVTTALTTYQSIAPFVKAGSNGAEKVFINGGSGGTGTMAVQIAKALGCHVTATCSTRNIELVKSLGADEVIDYTSQDVVAELTSKGKVFKLVVDNVGNSPANLYKAADNFLVEQGAQFVQVGGGASAADIKILASRSLVPSFLGGGRHKYMFILPKLTHDNIVDVANLIRDDKLKPVIDEVFEWSDAPAAYTKLKTGRARGNIVVRGPPAKA